MTNKEVNAALRQVAKNNGVSVATILREINLVMEDAQKNPDPNIQAFWKSAPRKGGKPTPEEIITHIAGIIDKG